MLRSTRAVASKDEGAGAGHYSDPPLLVLASLANGPKHGHAMVEDIAHPCGTRLGPGTLYGAIARLEQQGWIEPLPQEERRQPYRITGEGLRVLRQTDHASAVQQSRAGETASIMNPRLAHLLVVCTRTLERYGAEFEEFVQTGDSDVRTGANVAWSAVCEHINPKSAPRSKSTAPILWCRREASERVSSRSHVPHGLVMVLSDVAIYGVIHQADGEPLPISGSC